MKHRNNAVGLLAAVLLLLAAPLFLASCFKPEPHRLGFLGSLTGSMADVGVAGRDGVILAVEEVNRLGGVSGRLVELIIKDDGNNPGQARDAVRQLVKAGVAGIIGPTTSSMALAISSLIDELEVATISPTAGTNELAGKSDYFLRVYPAHEHEAKNLAELAFFSRGYRRLAVVYDLSNRGYTQDLFEHFKQYFQEHGGVISQALSYTTRTDTDFMLLASQLAGSSPDAICIIAGGRDTAMISQQLEKLGFTIPILASEWAATGDLLRYGGRAVEGLESFHSYDRNSTTPAFAAFRQQYLERFHHEPAYAAIHAYEAARVLLSMLNQAGAPRDMPQAIIGAGTFDGLQSEIVFDRFGDVQRPHILKTIKNGVFVRRHGDK